MPTGRRRLPVRHPAIQIHQSSAEQWPAIRPVEGPLAAISLPWIGVLQWKGRQRVLGPAKMVNAYRPWHLQVTAAGYVDVHQGTMATPVFGRRVGMQHFGHFAAGGQT